jgi:hypothetical protein
VPIFPVISLLFSRNRENNRENYREGIFPGPFRPRGRRFDLDYHAFGCEMLFFEQGTLRTKAGNCGIASLMRVGLHSRYGFSDLADWRIYS